MESTLQQHWDHVYLTKPSDKVSWFQDKPEISLKLIHSVSPLPQQRILDVGSGVSTLIPSLMQEGFQNLFVLDISAIALEKAKIVLGPEKSHHITWIHQDVRDLALKEQVFIWHDRAVLHFLSDKRDQVKYVEALKRNLQPNGFFVVGTFAKEGATQCSGLDTVQYDAQRMQQLLGSSFSLIHEEEEAHMTPTGTMQPFWYGVFKLDR